MKAIKIPLTQKQARRIYDELNFAEWQAKFELPERSYKQAIRVRKMFLKKWNLAFDGANKKRRKEK